MSTIHDLANTFLTGTVRAAQANAEALAKYIGDTANTTQIKTDAPTCDLSKWRAELGARAGDDRIGNVETGSNYYSNFLNRAIRVADEIVAKVAS